MSSLAVLQERGAVVRDIEPFRQWVERRLAEQRARGARNPHVRCAEALGVSTRRLYEWLHEWVFIDELDVDKALTRDGRFSLNDLYDGGLVSYRTPTPPPPSTECATHGCMESRNGGRFCHRHTKELARIRAEFEEEGAIMARSGGAPKRLATRRQAKQPPTCCNPHCWNPRNGVEGESFCDACQADGWIEEDE